jgi:TetR/AcrR family transcriptional repressor of lmrAB and yxaGH operons
MTGENCRCGTVRSSHAGRSRANHASCATLTEYDDRSTFAAMGQKGAATRSRLLDSTQSLIEARGYFGTGLNQILADSGAPRGSLYFHFPGGKDELVAEALTRAGAEIDAVIRGIAAADTAELIAILLGLLGDRLESSGWSQGCPVATVALETSASNDAIQQICATTYANWQLAVQDKLRADGRDNACDLATTLLALIEGALLLARTHRSIEPLKAVSRTITTLL